MARFDTVSGSGNFHGRSPLGRDTAKRAPEKRASISGATGQPVQDAGKADHKGRFQQVNDFVDTSMAGLTRSELGTWFVLWRVARGDIAHVSQQAIVDRVGCSISQVKRAIKSLKAKGLIEVIHQGSQSNGATKYRIRSTTTPRIDDI